METLNKSIHAPLKAVSSGCGIDGKPFIQRILKKGSAPEALLCVLCKGRSR